MNPLVHSESAARIWGGKATDYLPIHELMDTSKEAFPDNRHRALTHNNWFSNKIVPICMGTTVVKDEFVSELETAINAGDSAKALSLCGKLRSGPPVQMMGYIINSDGKRVFVKDIAYQHCIEDFSGWVPSASDYLGDMSLKAWMNNAMGGAAPPPSREKYKVNRTTGSTEPVSIKQAKEVLD